jgi:hypothetical protein
MLEERGGATKRRGCDTMGTFGASVDRIISMYTFYRGASPPQIIIHTSAGTLYYTNDPTVKPPVWTQIATGLSANARFSYATFNSKVYMSNGVDPLCAWTGSAFTTFPSAPKGRFLCLWKDTMWISGIVGSPDRVYTSAPGDPETYPVAGWVDLAKGDGDVMMALGTDGLYLVPFKRNRTFTIYDPTTFANRVIDFEKVCESHFSIIQFESSIYFISRRGVCEYLGDSPSRYLSYKIDPMWTDQIINLAALDSITAYSWNTRVGWAIPERGSAYPSMQIEYYPRLAQRSTEDSPGLYGTLLGPFVFHRMPTSTFAGYRWGTLDRLYAGHNNANKFMQAFTSQVGTDDGQTFQGLVEIGTYDMGVPDHIKYIQRLRLLGRGKFSVQLKRNFEAGVYRSYPVNMSATLDQWSTLDKWGVGAWGPNSTLSEARVDTDAYVRYLVIRFVDAETGTNTRPTPVGSVEYQVSIGEWSLYGVVVESIVLGVRE